MTLEEAIKTALEYEKRIRDLYLEGADLIKNEIGKDFFKTFAKDEESHVQYLEKKLGQWHTDGKIDIDTLETIIPSKETIEDEVGRLKSRIDDEHRGVVQQMLSRALKVEVETSAFYSKMVDELPKEGRELFKRFLDIENNHINAVQYELDYITNTGYWFGFKEFDME
jgi:rubrerythrin